MPDARTTVVLVEDDDGDAALVEESLQRSGRPMEVRRATRLREGIVLAGGDGVDVVLLDLSLPDSSGIATVERAVSELPDVPVVVLTGTDDSQLADQAVHLGAQDYLVKGIDGDTLRRVVRHAIERYAATRELWERNEELARANQFKDDFIAIASHELRTPAGVISGAAQAAQDHWHELGDDDRLRFIRMVGRQSERLLALVDDLLVMARVDRGAAEPTIVPTDLLECVRESVELSRIAPSDVELRVAATVAHTAPDHVIRILVNLLDNADKYGAPPVVVEVTADGDGVELRVRDHGPGIDQGLSPHLFERFARANSPEVRRQVGTGLGLAIVAALAQGLGGEVHLEDTAGAGALFVVRLPVPGLAAAVVPVPVQPGSTAEIGSRGRVAG